MMMFPGHGAHSNSKNKSYYYDYCFISLGDHLMGEEDICSKEATAKDIINTNIEEDGDGGWLRLSLGIRPSPNPQISTKMELHLSPATTSNNNSSSRSSSSSVGDLTRPHPPSLQQQFSFQVIPMIPAAPTDSAMTFSHHPMYTNTLSYLPFRPLTSPSSFSSTIEFRPSRPPHSPGLWFILQASQTQTKEPYLPQLPKSYLRIKDGRTTVGLLLKYLVYKLKLDGEFEIEISCKGQQLLPFLSLQHVRDNIWNRPRNDVVFLNSSASSVDHLIMVLNYGRIA